MSRRPTLQETQKMSMVLVRIIDEICENGSCEKLTTREVEKIKDFSIRLANELNWAVYNDRIRRSNESE